ncbi:MAG: 4Fe-4S binding protein [Planctomycetes bacterium]|nr:4Fe-4S binding protein [Planctomycetota bacterium]
MRARTANIFFGFLKKSKRTGWRGRAWNWLEKTGPVTRSSPVRRGIQIVCLVLFLDAFFRVCWPYAEQFSSTTFSDKETFPVESFLLIDPLVGLSTALAGKFLNWPTLLWMVGILAFCIVIPRAFCGYFCPLGTLIDAFDWLIGRHFKKWHVEDNPTDLPKPRRWVHFKYWLLAGVLITSLCGVLTSGFVSAIPILTRGLLFTGGRGQVATMKGASHLAPAGPMLYVSLGLFAVVFLLSLKGRRFWCRYVCPSGAMLSVFNFFRVGERKVESTCINCNKCVEACPFDAIQEDFTTRNNDCTYCQSCGGVCPTDAIKFVTRWNDIELKVINDPPVQPRPVSRRGFVAAGVLGGLVAAATRAAQAAGVGNGDSSERPLRPPGSVPEPEFLDLCIRCGECFKVCPGPVLHPAGLEHGFESLWTPVAVPEHAGCHQDCSFCTQVCPTGAIQPLDLPVKRETHMGLAKVNTKTCLPFREDGREDCDLCFQECTQAGYNAIEMRPIELEVDRMELEMAGFSDPEIDEMATILAPYVLPDRCVGCGICTYRCHQKYVVQEGRLDENAIPVFAENEDRLMSFPIVPGELHPTT